MEPKYCGIVKNQYFDTVHVAPPQSWDAGGSSSLDIEPLARVGDRLTILVEIRSGHAYDLNDFEDTVIQDVTYKRRNNPQTLAHTIVLEEEQILPKGLINRLIYRRYRITVPRDVAGSGYGGNVRVQFNRAGVPGNVTAIHTRVDSENFNPLRSPPASAPANFRGGVTVTVSGQDLQRIAWDAVVGADITYEVEKLTAQEDSMTLSKSMSWFLRILGLGLLGLGESDPIVLASQGTK